MDERPVPVQLAAREDRTARLIRIGPIPVDRVVRAVGGRRQALVAGVERAVLAYDEKGDLTIDLISFERILFLWQGTVSIRDILGS